MAQAPYDAQTIILSPGDLLVLTTDGITEARSKGRFFGYEGLVQAVRENAHCESLAQIGQTVAEQAQAFAGGKRQDDVCLLLARRQGQ